MRRQNKYIENTNLLYFPKAENSFAIVLSASKRLYDTIQSANCRAAEVVKQALETCYETGLANGYLFTYLCEDFHKVMSFRLSASNIRRWLEEGYTVKYSISGIILEKDGLEVKRIQAQEVSLGKFLRSFGTPISDAELDEFYRCLDGSFYIDKIVWEVISSSSVYSLYDAIEQSYNAGFYAEEDEDSNDEDDTLHNSCMRYTPRAKNAAHFYSQCNVRMIVGRLNNRIVCRAIVWPDVECRMDDRLICKGVYVLDRIYSTSISVRDALIRFAKKIGVHLYRYGSSYSENRSFRILNTPPGTHMSADSSYELKLYYFFNPGRFTTHQYVGCPYLDTFDRMGIFLDAEDHAHLYLTNSTDLSHFKEVKSFLSRLRNTSGVYYPEISGAEIAKYGDDSSIQDIYSFLLSLSSEVGD